MHWKHWNGIVSNKTRVNCRRVLSIDTISGVCMYLYTCTFRSKQHIRIQASAIFDPTAVHERWWTTLCTACSDEHTTTTLSSGHRQTMQICVKVFTLKLKGAASVILGSLLLLIRLNRNMLRDIFTLLYPNSKHVVWCILFRYTKRLLLLNYLSTEIA